MKIALSFLELCMAWKAKSSISTYWIIYRANYLYKCLALNMAQCDQRSSDRCEVVAEREYARRKEMRRRQKEAKEKRAIEG